MTNEEKLLHAIGEISDDIILEASTPYKQSLINKKSLTIAASIAAVAVGISILPLALGNAFDKGAAGGNSAPEMGGSMNNSDTNLDISETSYGILECTIKTDGHTFNFALTLYADLNAPLDVTFMSKDGSVIYTTEDIGAEDAEVRRPTITVNGEVTESLPSAAGEYSINISFDGMEVDKEWKSYIRFTDFGPFYRFN